MWKIPVKGINEQFDISILGQSYDFMFKWEDVPCNSWTFSFGQKGTWWLQGMILTLGVDLIKPLKNMALPFQLKLGYIGENSGLTQSNFGTKYNLYVVENDV